MIFFPKVVLLPQNAFELFSYSVYLQLLIDLVSRLHVGDFCSAINSNAHYSLFITRYAPYKFFHQAQNRYSKYRDQRDKLESRGMIHTLIRFEDRLSSKNSLFCFSSLLLQRKWVRAFISSDNLGSRFQHQ